MSIKTSAAYDEAGFRTTKSLVDIMRQLFGRTVPDSLKGEPPSLNGGSLVSRRRVGTTPTRKRSKSMKKK